MWGKIIRFLSKFKSKAPAPNQPPVVAPKPLPEVPPIEPIEMGTIDLIKFIKSVEGKFGILTNSQKSGFIYIIQEWKKTGFTDLRWLAYALATTWHETARTMQPITEYGSQAYLRGKKYWPFIGRGYVQLTWLENYKKYGIDKAPLRALEPALAAHIMFDGMSKGIFTGKKFRDYFNQTTDNAVAARRIINGTDKAVLISTYHQKFLFSLASSKSDKPNVIG